MEQVGYVIGLNDGLAALDVRRTSACGADCSSCHGSCEEKVERIELINTLGAKVGDYVELKADSKRVLSYIVLVYGLPLVGFLLGAILGNYSFAYFRLPYKELFAFILGLVFLFLSYLAISSYDKKVASQHNPIQMVRILK